MVQGAGAVADRFYCPGLWVGSRATLIGDEAKHLARVRRVGVGERVELFDGQGKVAEAEVTEVGRDRVELAILTEGPGGRDLDGSLILATAVPKGDRFDWLVEKATELGVTRLVPILTERSVVDPRAAKLERLRRLVIEACKQSGRSRLMELSEPRGWDEWLRFGNDSGEMRLVAHPGGVKLPELQGKSPVTIAIGPEGGFTHAEIAAAQQAGYQRIGLGPTILRVETAALVACALVSASLEAAVGGAQPTEISR
jgi:16S rRNA (uracil1498-N3)-methyltransferase